MRILRDEGSEVAALFSSILNVVMKRIPIIWLLLYSATAADALYMSAGRRFNQDDRDGDRAPISEDPVEDFDQLNFGKRRKHTTTVSLNFLSTDLLKERCGPPRISRKPISLATKIANNVGSALSFVVVRPKR
jgi:hypothetical protein